MGIYAPLWKPFVLYNTSANLIRGIEHLYGKAISEVQVNGITEDWLIILLNVTMPSLVYSLLHSFLERVISYGKASIGDRTIPNLWSSDNIDAPDC